MAGPLEAGKWYWVPSVALGPLYHRYLPVINNLHVDEGLGIPHYNFDGRFFPKKMRRLYFNAERQNVALAEAPVTLQVHRCLRIEPLPEEYYAGSVYSMFETACTNKIMENMTCPHRGTDLSTCPVVGGIVTCPSHGLRWRVSDGVLVQNAETQEVHV